MRTLTLAVAAALTAAPLLATAPASACAPPAEGGSTCSCVRYIYVDVAGQHVAIPDPRFSPPSCD